MALTRSTTDVMISGIASGMAKRFGIDVVASRLLWFLFLLVSGGTAILIYLLMWLIVPEETIGSE